ncbi:hypothetical protein J2S28_004636 [Rhizobium sp. SLBN-94]|nr:hypothetical protein [Rhizobium sp. SLBN-94]
MKTKPPVMSVELKAALNAVGEKLYNGKALQGEVEAVIRLLDDLSPLSVTLVSGVSCHSSFIRLRLEPRHYFLPRIKPTAPGYSATQLSRCFHV